MSGPTDKLDPGLIAFIKSHFDSVEQLEVLLLMRNDPTRLRTAADISRDLRSSAASTAKRLSKLAAQRLIAQVNEAEGTYKYEPATPELAERITALAEAYLVRRVTVIDLIFSNPVEKIKTLADAFKLRGDK